MIDDFLLIAIFTGIGGILSALFSKILKINERNQHLENRVVKLETERNATNDDIQEIRKDIEQTRNDTRNIFKCLTNIQIELKLKNSNG